MRRTDEDSRKRKKMSGIISAILIIVGVPIVLTLVILILSSFAGSPCGPINMFEGVALQIRNAVAAHMADHGAFPPKYGYVRPEFREKLTELLKPENRNGKNDLPPEAFCQKPYLFVLDPAWHRNEDYMDRLSDKTSSFDTDFDGLIDLLEFSRFGQRAEPYKPSEFPTLPPYLGPDAEIADEGLAWELERNKNQALRPMVYIPVSKRNFELARSYWIENKDFLAETWNPEDPDLQGIEFPPESYDAYALISQGPGEGGTGGILDPPEAVDGEIEPEILHHVAALRAYFLAMRDLNDNNKLDFDYIARTEHGEAELEYEAYGGSTDNHLPNFEPSDGWAVYFGLASDYLGGPIIYHFES